MCVKFLQLIFLNSKLNMLNEKINENLKHFLSELQKQKSYQQLSNLLFFLPRAIIALLRPGPDRACFVKPGLIKPALKCKS